MVVTTLDFNDWSFRILLSSAEHIDLKSRPTRLTVRIKGELMIPKRHRRLFILAVLGTLSATVGTCRTTLANPNPTTNNVISIAEARSLPLGTVVTIFGSVTVPSAAFSSSTFDQGFAIQDRTGGIYVSVVNNLGFGLRQQVRVTGTLADTVLPGLLVLVDVT